MKKIFISYPMRGLTEEQILKERKSIKLRVKEIMKEEVEFIDSFVEDYPGENNKHAPIWYLGKSIEFLSQADIVYFAGDWRNARGCKIEHEVAIQYGINIIVDDILFINNKDY